jgi:hypothetical protein
VGIVQISEQADRLAGADTKVAATTARLLEVETQLTEMEEQNTALTNELNGY